VSEEPAEAGGGDEAPRKPRLIVHAALFLATFLTTTITGAIYKHRGASIAPINDGLIYSIPLMLILLCHEAGHYIVARRYGVDASLPYFIPFPFGPLGTMGAVIGMRRSATDRKQLFDVGAAGPLAGLAVAIPVLVVGLLRSDLGPVLHPGVDGMMEGNSILYAVLKRLVTGLWLPNSQTDVQLHPMAYAGWAGLLVTMINLVPIGQLDGGHIASAYFGNRYNRFAEVLRRLLPIMAVCVFFWVMYVVKAEMGSAWNVSVGARVAMEASVFWLMWFLLVTLMRRLSDGVNHPPVDERPLPRSRQALFWLMVVVFVIVFMPVPMRVIPGSEVGKPAPPASASLTQ
jgi:membrane-associated protease RseP (regulator of RpoE activity)